LNSNQSNASQTTAHPQIKFPNSPWELLLVLRLACAKHKIHMTTLSVRDMQNRVAFTVRTIRRRGPFPKKWMIMRLLISPAFPLLRIGLNRLLPEKKDVQKEDVEKETVAKEDVITLVMRTSGPHLLTEKMQMQTGTLLCLGLSLPHQSTTLLWGVIAKFKTDAPNTSALNRRNLDASIARSIRTISMKSFTVKNKLTGGMGQYANRVVTVELLDISALGASNLQ
jgi:hypothetical protein